MEIELPVRIERQPDYTTCGPTALHAIFRSWGGPFGHFIVSCGYRDEDQSVAIADPLKDNPLHGTKYYRSSVHRLIGATFLGVGSDDGNLMRIGPKDWQTRLPGILR